MKVFTFSTLSIMILFLGLVGCKQKEEAKVTAETKKSEHLANVRHVTTTMTVQDIDLDKQLFTLQYAEGNVIVLQAAPNLPNIEDIKIGDEVEVKYIKSLMVFIAAHDAQRPAITEKKTITVSTEEGKPVEYIVDVKEKVSTVIAIDHDNREAILQDTEGNLHEVDLHHEIGDVGHVSVGDQVVYHYTESIAVHLVKV